MQSKSTIDTEYYTTLVTDIAQYEAIVAEKSAELAATVAYLEHLRACLRGE